MDRMGACRSSACNGRSDVQRGEKPRKTGKPEPACFGFLFLWRENSLSCATPRSNKKAEALSRSGFFSPPAPP
jgi:hypothetical protein